ncbi:Fanconi-associated nuclease 1-like protein [Vigna angularis]|uniref:Fanconi-associated nuclease n=1 Tax=Phaseolus angularis TaxID=3914 RepID=A0A8T0JTK7_PHAAN|nr:Fanconi-associated nuclease 1-like protein [Vigna angularis]
MFLVSSPVLSRSSLLETVGVASIEEKVMGTFPSLFDQVVLKQFKSSDPAPAVKKLPHNDALMAQVNSLRQELQLLARDRSITIVNSSGTGGKKYVTVIVIVVAGYGYIWWKGWKLPDLMFATKRSLSDACTSIGNQMGKLYGTIDDVKKKLSSRMNRLDESLDECAALTESTREEISVTQQKADTISGNFKSVHVAVRVLESRIKEIEEKQPSSSSSSRPAIELPPVSPSSRGSQSGSSRLSLEPPSVTPSAKDGSPSTILTDQPSPSNSGGSVQVCNILLGRLFRRVEPMDLLTVITCHLHFDNGHEPRKIKILLLLRRLFIFIILHYISTFLIKLMDRSDIRNVGCLMILNQLISLLLLVQVVTCHKTANGESKYADETFICLWKNVQHVVKFERRNPPSTSDILNNVSSMDDWTDSFTLLSNESQRLFIRLYTRKGPWFRMSSISYSEIVDTQKAVKELADKEYIHFIEDANQLCMSDVKDILNVLNVSELREIWSISLKKVLSLPFVTLLPKKLRAMTLKQHLISSIISSDAGVPWSQLSTMILERSSSCIRISSKSESLMWRTERLFFLNGEHDLSSFLLVDMGKIKYPAYNCIISEPIFSNRRNLLSYEEAIEVAQIMDEALDTNKIEVVLRCIKLAESRVSTDFSDRYSTSESVSSIQHLFTASWVYSKVVTVGISFLEQERRYTDAINLLRWLLNVFPSDLRRGYWTLRLSIDLEHLGFIDESLQVSENGLLDPWVRAGSRMALQRRVLCLGKPPRRWKVPSYSRSALQKIPQVFVQGRPLNSDLGGKSRYYNEEGKQCGVEELALNYYARDGGGWQGVHAESGIWLTIFGLLMWDVIYADVPNVFYTRFQNAPLDFGTDGFYTSRKSVIESHLQQIRDGMAEEFLIKSWETHFGTACRGVNWDSHSLDELRAAVTCVGGTCLASLCQLLAQDYRSWSSGMPDLLLWRFHGEYSGEAKLVEVKGHNDRLSEQQRAWLLLLMECGFSVEVCKVKLLHKLTF